MGTNGKLWLDDSCLSSEKKIQGSHPVIVCVIASNYNSNERSHRGCDSGPTGPIFIAVCYFFYLGLHKQQEKNTLVI